MALPLIPINIFDMQSVTELASSLASALDAPQPDAQHCCELMERLAALLHQSDDAEAQASAAAELDELLFDLHPALLAAAALSPAADAHVRALLAAAARCCTAREVFTLGMAALSQQLRWAVGRAWCSRLGMGPRMWQPLHDRPPSQLHAHL